VAYFNHVKSNVKGGVDVELGEKTIIVGPNGSGKSAVQNSLELATGGFVTDLKGRDEVRKESDLFDLGDGEELYAHATLNDDTTFMWRTSRSGKSVKKAESQHPGVVAWPVSDIESMLKGNAETQRKWLMQVAGTLNVPWRQRRASIHAYLTDTDLYDHMAARYSLPEAETLTKVLEAAASSARKTKTQITAAEQTIESMSRGLGAEPSERDLTALQKEVENCEAQVIIVPWSGPRITSAQVQQAEGDAMEAVSQWQKLVSDLEEAQDKRAEIQVPATAKLIESLAQTTQIAHELSFPMCVLCGSTDKPDWATLNRDYEGYLSRFAEARQLDTLIGLLGPQIESARQRAETNIARYEEIQQQYDPNAPAPVDNTTALQELREAQARLHEAQASVSNWRRVRDERELLKEKKAHYRDMTNMKDDCRKAMEELVRQAVSTIEEAVRAHLPDSDDFRLVLNGKSISMGFIRDDVLHTALSGAEWARLTMAVASARLRLTGHDGPVVISPKERAWDPATLTSAMRALTDAPGQVLLLSPIKPKGRLPKGWTMVEVG
jgi:energy-coupling factor transporter ATP-binding protein EcfA2